MPFRKEESPSKSLLGVAPRPSHWTFPEVSLSKFSRLELLEMRVLLPWKGTVQVSPADRIPLGSYA